MSEEGNTHVCVAAIPEDEFGGTICNQPVKLYNRAKGKGSSWITTRALEHMAKFHKDTQLSKDYDDRADVAHDVRVKSTPIVCLMFMMFPLTSLYI